ncbi:hypothetical protein [Nocardia sp. NPDC058705]|uniref:hypothetical protein n=1 Tax=Nocardia sp. NPDC058705 TaxID=3346609 RepID=UPI0036C9C61C
MHFLVLVLGADVEHQLAAYGDRATLPPYRRYVSPAELEVDQRVLREHPVDGVDPSDAAAVVRWGASGAEIGHDETGWFFWTTDNWRARWDYWTLGGRWSEHLIIKGTTLRYDAEAIKGSVDFDAMRTRAVAEAGQRWDEHRSKVATGQSDSLTTRIIGDLTREQFVAQRSWHPTFLVIDGVWYERGDLGYACDVGEERIMQWRTFVEEEIARLPDDTTISCVDCHR